METHASILAWRIPWTEDPGGLWFRNGIAIVGQDIELSLWHKLTQYCKAIILQLKVKEKIFF